jgi:serine/threonine-protein kinase
MGTVYRGTDTRLDRPVAVKVLHPHYARDAEVRQRLRAEARIQAVPNHPNIMPVYDFVAEEDRLCLVLEYAGGRTLEAVIREETGPMPYSRCREILCHVLAAVGYAHSRGVIHCDLQPSNAMLRQLRGQTIVKVMDFGVAKILGMDKPRTATDAKIGTLAYMSPEQVRTGKLADARSDIYALGVTLYEMATATLPFDGDSEYALMEAIVQGKPRAPTTFCPGVPPGFESVILRAWRGIPPPATRAQTVFGLPLRRQGPTPPGWIAPSPYRRSSVPRKCGCRNGSRRNAGDSRGTASGWRSERRWCSPPQGRGASSSGGNRRRSRRCSCRTRSWRLCRPGGEPC